MKLALITFGGLLLALVGITWWALESGGVAIIETRGADSTPRQTHVWYVEDEGVLWLEAGTPENGWYRDVRSNPSLAFAGGAHSGRYRARPLEDPATHTRIRSLIRAKYGLRDRWVGFLIVDNAGSVAVRLDPLETAGSQETP